MGFELSKCFLFITIDKLGTPDHYFTGVKSPVRAGCDWAASQVVQLVHYPTLDSGSNFQKEMTISEEPDCFYCVTAMLSAVYAVVCLCVCVSVTLRYCIKTAKRRITQTTPHDSAMTLVF